MGLGKKIVKQSVIVIIPLVILSYLVDWKPENMRFLRIFGNPDFIPVSIIIGGLLGLANLHGLLWSLERLLGARRADAKLIVLSMLRLFVLFGLIIVLTAFKVINFLGLLIGMTVVFKNLSR